MTKPTAYSTSGAKNVTISVFVGNTQCGGHSYSNITNTTITVLPTPTPTPTPCPNPPAVGQTGPANPTNDNTPSFTITDKGTACYSHDGAVTLRKDGVYYGSGMTDNNVFPAINSSWTWTHTNPLQDGIYEWRGWSRNNDPYYCPQSIPGDNTNVCWSTANSWSGFCLDTQPPSPNPNLRETSQGCTNWFWDTASSDQGCAGLKHYWLQCADNSAFSGGTWYCNETFTGTSRYIPFHLKNPLRAQSAILAHPW